MIRLLAARPAFRRAACALALGGAMMLGACGHADKASENASADNVEIPAEEAMSAVPAGENPVADGAPAAVDAASGSASGQ